MTKKAKLLIMAIVFILMGFATWQVVRWEERLALRTIDAVFLQEAVDTEAKAEVEELYSEAISISSIYTEPLEPTQEDIYNSMREWGILNPEDCIDGSMLIWDIKGLGVKCYNEEGDWLAELLLQQKEYDEELAHRQALKDIIQEYKQEGLK